MVNATSVYSIPLEYSFPGEAYNELNTAVQQIWSVLFYVALNGL